MIMQFVYIPIKQLKKTDILQSYCGDNDQWHFPAFALRDTIIHKNDRICQFRIMKKQPPMKFEVIECLNEISRGEIGSTGIK